jgi:glycosyltransferase involved in cell wall biosynthesis
LRTGAPAVSTVHDLAVFDVPWAFSGMRSRGERLLLKRSLRRADAIVAVSAFSAERVKAIFGRDATVTHLAPAPEFQPADAAAIDAVRTAHALPARFVLQVGTIEPRKDVHALAAACRTLGIPLVLAGGIGHGQQVPDGAHHLGYVDAAELPALYGAATIVAYISSYEGFGLPPVEAMACGAPVVATSVGALGEVAVGAARLVRHGDADALAAAIGDLWRDDAQRAELAASGLARARSLTWARTAATTAGVYRSLGVPIGPAP